MDDESLASRNAQSNQATAAIPATMKMATMTSLYADNLKEWLELANHVNDIGSDPIESWYDGPPFGKRYLNADLAVHIHLFFASETGGELGSHEYCALFHRSFSPLSGAAHEFHHIKYTDKGKGIRTEGAAGRYCDYSCEQMVFIEVRHVSKKSELMDIGTTPAVRFATRPVVRLKALNDCPMVRANLSEFIPRFRLEVFGVVENGELESSGLAVRKHPTRFEQGQLLNQIIERTPQVVHDIAYLNPDVFIKGTKVRRFIDVNDVVSALGIELGSETWKIHFNREKLVYIPLKTIAVMFGPVDLGPATGE